MVDKAIIVSRGLHPPWNMGEVVLARNFSTVLTKLYDDINVFSTIDKRRGPVDASDDELRLYVKYYRNEEELRSALLRELNAKSRADFHLINASLVKFASLAKYARRSFFYQFAYNILNDPRLITRSLGALPLTYLSNVRILTTALRSYSRLRSFFRRQFYYTPAPVDIPSYIVGRRIGNPSDKLRMLYLGHGSYSRFPYHGIINAILRLLKEGFEVDLNVYISKLGYANYPEFVGKFRRDVKELGLGDVVSLHLVNLSEAEKWKVICSSDIILFPSVINAAIDPPLIVLEAMFMGKCVVATPVQSIPHLLGEGRGIIVDVRDLEANIYRALRILALDRELLRECGARSEEWVRRNHSMDVVYDKMAGIIYGP